jgi:hypothetical protein
VEVQHKVGDDLEIVAARERAGRQEANDRLDASARWYDCQRDQFASAGKDLPSCSSEVQP